MKNAIRGSGGKNAITAGELARLLAEKLTDEERRLLEDSREKARSRVGESSASMLRWLADFAARSHGNRGEEIVTEWELEEFLRAQSLTRREARGERAGLIVADSHEPRLMCPPGLLPKLQAGIQDCFEALRKANVRGEEPAVEFHFPAPIRVGLVGERLGDLDSPVRVSSVVAPQFESVFWAAVDLLLVGINDFRFCDRAACGRPFVPERRWQRFCGPVCASRERQARYRGRPENGDKLRRERERRYEERIREKHPKARITRRQKRREKGSV